MKNREFNEVLERLEKGELRAATFKDGVWSANVEVKRAILDAFKAGVLVDMEGFVDKDTIPPQKFTVDRDIRIVPTGSAVRKGSYVAPGVIIMPPSYVNIGVFVDEGTLIDSHVLVGSCAQIGKNVHLSAAVQIGGVLEPIGESPVIIEDDAFIGAGAVIVEGIVVKKGAVIAPGVTLSKAIPIYDCVNNRMLSKGEAIPEMAVVVPGSRRVKKEHSWAYHQGLSLHCAIIIKYRDSKTDTSLELEKLLR